MALSLFMLLNLTGMTKLNLTQQEAERLTASAMDIKRFIETRASIVIFDGNKAIDHQFGFAFLNV